jgi:hypothetical protein
MLQPNLRVKPLTRNTKQANCNCNEYKFSPKMSPLGGFFQLYELIRLVSPSQEYWSQDLRCIMPMDNGFAVFWVYVHQIYGQVLSLIGEKNGAAFIMGNAPWKQMHPEAAWMGNDHFICIWLNGSIPEKLEGQLFSANGTPVSSLFTVHPNTTYQNDIIALPNGDVVISFSTEEGLYFTCLPNSPQLHHLVPFALLEPAYDASLKTTAPLLKWRRPSAIPVGYSFELQFSVFYDTDPLFSSPTIKQLEKDTSYICTNLKVGNTYFWKVLAKNMRGDSIWSNTSAFYIRPEAAAVESKNSISSTLNLAQNFPNPCNPNTTIEFEISVPGEVEFNLYNILGQKIMTKKQYQSAGMHKMQLPANKLDTGVYVYEIKTGNFAQRKKLVVQK